MLKKIVRDSTSSTSGYCFLGPEVGQEHTKQQFRKSFPICDVCNKRVERIEILDDDQEGNSCYRIYCHGDSVDVRLSKEITPGPIFINFSSKCRGENDLPSWFGPERREEERLKKVDDAKKTIMEACEGACGLIEGLDVSLPLSLEFTMIANKIKVRIDIDEIKHEKLK